MASAKLKIAGMTCDHCRQTVEKALKSVGGTWGVAVFLDEGEAEVDYDEQKASVDLHIRAVEGAGYGVKLAE